MIRRDLVVDIIVLSKPSLSAVSATSPLITADVEGAVSSSLQIPFLPSKFPERRQPARAASSRFLLKKRDSETVKA